MFVITYTNEAIAELWHHLSGAAPLWVRLSICCSVNPCCSLLSHFEYTTFYLNIPGRCVQIWRFANRTRTYCDAVRKGSSHSNTHTFNGPFSGTTQVSRYQKGKTDLDFTEARESEWQWHQLGHMQVCNSLQTDNHASTPPLSFLQAGCPSCRPTNSVKALKALKSQQHEWQIWWRLDV